MDRSNPGTNANRWLAFRVVDLGKVPMKFFLVWGLYSAVAIITIMVFLTAFSSGIVFGIPVDFAVDNEERVYLSYESGVYVVEQGKRCAICARRRAIACAFRFGRRHADHGKYR
jgi:hypothetical protein